MSDKAKGKLAVVAIGGNALSPDKDHLSILRQYEKVQETALHIAAMMQEGWNVVVSHGNGPQVGMILRRSELSRHEVPPVPMDYAGADIQGAVGYMFCKALGNAFRRLGIDRRPVALVAQTLVSLDDPAFKAPSKPIGDWFSAEAARELARDYGWTVVEDAGRGWRRVVPSPDPVEIIEESAIRLMVEAGLTVTTLGGGGVPVIRNAQGDLEGVEAVIDKDMSSALLAARLGADMLILPTAVERVALRFGKPDQKWLDSLSLAEAAEHLASGEFPPGSMGPKIRALAKFVKETGGAGLITTPEKLREAVQGKTGTRIVR